MQPAYMRSVSFLGKFTSGSRISASRSDLLKLPNTATTRTTATTDSVVAVVSIVSIVLVVSVVSTALQLL